MPLTGVQNPTKLALGCEAIGTVEWDDVEVNVVFLLAYVNANTFTDARVRHTVTISYTDVESRSVGGPEVEAQRSAFRQKGVGEAIDERVQSGGANDCLVPPVFMPISA